MEKIRIGVFGAGRGADIAKNFMLQAGCEIVALCDFHKHRREHGAKKLGGDIALYENFDEFIEHGMDAVILGNYFHEHAPYAVKCLERGIHVYSECLSNGTMAEGVELIRAAEKSSAIYMLAENYPQMLVNKEMQRICNDGSLGKIMFAEGEYNHPTSPTDTGFAKAYNYFRKHWRNYTPATYYITHSLGPVMKATGATPRKVSAYAIYAPFQGNYPYANNCGDRTAIMTTENDDGSVFRITGCAKFGAHGNAYRICGTEGQIENLRGMGDRVMLRYNSWSRPDDKEESLFYTPSWRDHEAAIIKRSGHGGSDYLTTRIFVECLQKGEQPPHPFDVHSAVNMSSVAILAHRAILEGGGSYDIPDFHKEDWRKKYENDRLSPYYGTDGSEPTIPCCSNPDYKPTDEQLRLYDEMVATFWPNNL